jgi:hypothetical protein
MVNRWADKQLKNWEAALLSLEAGWNQYNQATRGIPEALAAGIPISSIQATYALDWEKVTEAIAYHQFRGPQSYQLWEWWFAGQNIKLRLQQLRRLTKDYNEQVHPFARLATEFWLGFDEGKVNCRTIYIEDSSNCPIINLPTPHQKGELLGWQYATVKQQVKERLHCCCLMNSELFTWG